MKAKIVKLKNGRFAVRKWFCIFGYQYADIDDLKNERKIYWWTNETCYSEFSTENLDTLEKIVEKYTVPPEAREIVLRKIEL